MKPSIFSPASDVEMRSELAQLNAADLLALAEMHILFSDEDGPEHPGRLAFYRRREIAREMVAGTAPSAPEK
jgi:hypothetical protein